MFYLKDKICRNNKLKLISLNNVIEIVNDKFMEKMELFYYLKLLNRIDIFEKILFSSKNSNLLKLITNKSFRINLDNNLIYE